MLDREQFSLQMARIIKAIAILFVSGVAMIMAGSETKRSGQPIATLRFERSRHVNKTSVRMKAMRGRIALQKHFVRNVSADVSTVSPQLWECARVLASLLFSNMRNIEDVTVK